MALARADAERGGDGRIPAIYGVAGSVLLPIIRYSVVWWNTLHQGQSIGLTSSTIDAVDPVAAAGSRWAASRCLFAGVVLMRMRAMLARDQGRGADAADGDGMNPWPFVIAAYALTLAGVGRRWPLWSWLRDARGGARQQVKAKNQRLMLAGLAVAGGRRARACSRCRRSRTRRRSSTRRATSRRTGLPLGRAVRLGGMVAGGSIKRPPDGVTMHFVVTDGVATMPVTFSGIAPDLFREKSGVVAEGQFQPDGSFVATNLLAKHDEKYMPPELAGKMHETKTLKP